MKFLGCRIGLIATVITMAYSLWMIKRVFLGKLPEHLENTKEASWYVTAPMMVLVVFTMLLEYIQISSSIK